MKPTVPENIPVRTRATKTTDLTPFGPYRPRFLKELVVVPFKEEIIVEGAGRLQAIQDTTENNMLVDLIGLMNGDRTLDELKSALPGTPEEEVLETISSLYQFGLVEDGAVGSESEYSNPDTLAFLRRCVRVIGANRSGAQAYQRLLTSEVLVFDDALGHSECLRDLLIRTGVGRVVSLKRSLPSAWRQRASVAQSIAISLSFSGEDREWHEQLDEWCFKNQLPWLRLVLSKHYADFGPLFDGERTPCYRCFQEVHPIRHHSSGDGFERRVEESYWTGIAAIELIYFLGRIGPLTTERTVERYDLQLQSSRRLHFLRVPGCSRCRPLTPEHANAAIDAAVAFEDYIALPARPRIPAAVQEDYSRISSFLLTQTKRMPNCPHVRLRPSLSPLERSALEILDQPVSGHVITVDDLSTMLMATAGIREPDGENVQRWTATAGNLGSVELFVLVRRIDGLKPGIYFYQSDDHSLASFQPRGQTSAIAEIMQRVAVIDSADLPDVMVVFTGAYHRVEQKYGEFAYKLINLDAGVAVNQLHFVANSLGLFTLTAVRWADDLIEQTLNLVQRQEQVTAVVGLYGTTPEAVQSTDDAITATWQPHRANRPSDFCELGLGEVGERVYRESRIDEQDLRSSPPPMFSSAGAVPRGPTLPLPPPETSGGLTAGNILAQRVTVRNYGDDHVSPSDLGTMLYYAHRGDREQWSAQHPLTFYVLAWNLAGFEPAVYAYDADNHGLQFVAPARSVPESMELFVQPEFATAAVIIWITGALAATCAGLGPLGHRYLLLRAGSAGHRLWTAALAKGLSGGVTAGVICGAAREQFGLDGYQQVSLLAFATGVEAADADETEPDEESE